LDTQTSTKKKNKQTNTKGRLESSFRILSAATNTMEKGRRRKNKNKKNNFIFWTLVLSFLFLFFPPPLFPSELALFFFNRMWAGIDHPDIIMILDVNRTWILTHRRR
jgi:hypothetical protein